MGDVCVRLKTSDSSLGNDCRRLVLQPSKHTRHQTIHHIRPLATDPSSRADVAWLRSRPSGILIAKTMHNMPPALRLEEEIKPGASLNFASSKLLESSSDPLRPRTKARGVSSSMVWVGVVQTWSSVHSLSVSHGPWRLRRTFPCQ